MGHVFLQPKWTPNLNWASEHLSMCTGWVKPWANSNIVVVGELRSIRDKEISVPNWAYVCLLFNIAWYANSIDLDLYSAVRVLDIFCCFVTSIHSASCARNVFEIWSFYWSAVSLVNKICIEGLFSYISESRFPSINHSNDIASTNKLVYFFFSRAKEVAHFFLSCFKSVITALHPG